MRGAEWERSAAYPGGFYRYYNGFDVQVMPSRSGRWEYTVKRNGRYLKAGTAASLAAAKRAATKAAQRGKAQVLRAGNWQATWSPVRDGVIELDYVGKVFKRSQTLIIYDDGAIGYEFPEAVPASARQRIRAWTRKLPRKGSR